MPKPKARPVCIPCRAFLAEREVDAHAQTADHIERDHYWRLDIGLQQAINRVIRPSCDRSLHIAAGMG